MKFGLWFRLIYNHSMKKLMNIINSDIKYIHDNPSKFIAIVFIVMLTLYLLTPKEVTPITIINSERINILNSIDENNKIVFKAKNEQYIVHVFTDIDCFYCAKLHSNMKVMNALGITVKYLASPMQELHPNAQSGMEKIWCAKDKASALHYYKTLQYLPNSPDCINPVAEQLAISKQLGVWGTPTIFFENGSNIPGYQEPDELLNDILQSIAQ
jgi:thiol:disulfide interchange protein DsbC